MTYVGRQIPCWALLLAASVPLHAQEAPLTRAERIELRRIAKSKSFKISSEIGHGSGVLIRKFPGVGVVLTNAHVVRDSESGRHASQLSVRTPGGDTRRGYLLAVYENRQASLDYALVGVGNPDTLGSPVPVAPSVSQGDWIVLVGNPLDEEFLVAEGQVGPIERGGRKAIHTATAQSGASGGGVFDRKGRLVGLHTLGVTARDGSDTSVMYLVRWFLDQVQIHSVRVQANLDWQSTGILVDRGASVFALAAGNASMGPLTANVPPYGVAGRESYSRFPEHAHGCVLVQIGSMGPVHAVNRQFVGVTSEDSSVVGFQNEEGASELRVAVNDRSIDNNQGSFILLVAVDSLGAGDAATPAVDTSSAERLLSEGRPEEAEAALCKILELAPTNADALYLRGTARYALGRPVEAAHDFERALELNPQASWAQYALETLRDLRRLR